MNTRKGVLWYLVNGAMELSWFFAWAMFSAIATMGRPFPFLDAIAVFAVAAMLTRVSMGKGWRIAQVLGLQAFGLVGAASTIIHGLYYGSYPLLTLGWLTLFFETARSSYEWLILFLNLFWTVLLWVGGVALARRAKGYYTTCNRFDFGLTAFFALFATKLIMLAKGQMQIADPVSILFVYPFFLFSLLSIGMVRMQSKAPKTFLPGHQALGIMVSFFAVVLLGVGGVTLFFWPGLTLAAEMGYRVIRVAGGPVGSIFISIVRFIFMPRSSRPEAAAEPSRGIDWAGIKSGTHSWWIDLVEKILGWGLWGLVLIICIVSVGVATYYVMKWLLSRTSMAEKSEAERRSGSTWFVRLRNFLSSAWKKMVRATRGYEKAAELYDALLGWARRSGFSRVRSETPLELAARLNRRFPVLKPQIELIINAFNVEVYGEAVLSGTQMADVRSAWRALRSPLHWPSRIKTWFLRPSGTTRSSNI